MGKSGVDIVTETLANLVFSQIGFECAVWLFSLE